MDVDGAEVWKSFDDEHCDGKEDNDQGQDGESLKIENRKQYNVNACADPEGEGGTGDTDPPGKLKKNIGFFSNTCPDPLKITKLPSQHSMLGNHRPARETPFKWRFAGGPSIARQ